MLLPGFLCLPGRSTGSDPTSLAGDHRNRHSFANRHRGLVPSYLNFHSVSYPPDHPYDGYAARVGGDAAQR